MLFLLLSAQGKIEAFRSPAGCFGPPPPPHSLAANSRPATGVAAAAAPTLTPGSGPTPGRPSWSSFSLGSGPVEKKALSLPQLGGGRGRVCGRERQQSAARFSSGEPPRLCCSRFIAPSLGPAPLPASRAEVPVLQAKTRRGQMRRWEFEPRSGAEPPSCSGQSGRS